MSNIDFLGADGGRLSMAFATGAVATFGFLTMVGGWLWKFVGKTRTDEIDRLKAKLEDERRRCELMEARMVQRIQLLEGMVLMNARGAMRQETQAAISEARMEWGRQNEDGAEDGAKEEQ